MNPNFSDANRPPAEAVGGIGDINSAARGSGARFNAGKPALDLIPLRLIAQMFDGRQADGMIDIVIALMHVGRFQETGDQQHLKFAIIALSHYWESCARVFDYGRKKYAAWNWAKGMAWSIPLACIGRHALKALRGEYADDESGEARGGHILCNLVMLATYVDTYPEGNDLPPRALFEKRTADDVCNETAGAGVSVRDPYSTTFRPATAEELRADLAYSAIAGIKP